MLGRLLAELGTPIVNCRPAAYRIEVMLALGILEHTIVNDSWARLGVTGLGGSGILIFGVKMGECGALLAPCVIASGLAIEFAPGTWAAAMDAQVIKPSATAGVFRCAGITCLTVLFS